MKKTKEEKEREKVAIRCIILSRGSRILDLTQREYKEKKGMQNLKARENGKRQRTIVRERERERKIDRERFEG